MQEHSKTAGNGKWESKRRYIPVVEISVPEVIPSAVEWFLRITSFVLLESQNPIISLFLSWMSRFLRSDTKTLYF